MSKGSKIRQRQAYHAQFRNKKTRKHLRRGKEEASKGK